MMAIIVAIVVVVVTWGAAAPLVVIGLAAMAGAAAGAVGGAIAGTGVLQGAIQGAAVGAAIGAGAVAGAAMGPGAVTGVASPVMSVAEAAAIAGATVVPSVSGAVAGVALSAASSLYSGAMQEQIISDAFSVMARQLNGLPGHDRVRESVFLDALPRLVDDPNKTDDPTTSESEGSCHWPTPTDPEAGELVPGDPQDADGDGNTTESIPCFEYWIDRRIVKLKEGLPEVGAAIQAFLDGPVSTFETQAEAAFRGSGAAASQCGDPVCDYDEACGFINECEIDCGVCPSEGGGGSESE
jgi:hypothetical protein